MDKYGQMSKWNKPMTFLSIGIVIGFSFIPWLIGNDNNKWFWSALIIYISILLVTLVAYLFIPLDISVSNIFFRINFPLRKKIIPIKYIKSASVYHISKDFKCIIGARGYFGWWGKFHDKFGPLVVFASNVNQLILVELKNGKRYVVSCLDSKIMSDSINKRMGTKP